MPRRTKEFVDKSRLEKSGNRFTVKEMINDEFYNLIHLERRRFIYTAWDLTVRPSKAIRMLFQGYRRYLYPYFNYLILIGTITIFLSVRYKFFVSGYDLGEQPGFLGTILDSMGFDRQFRTNFFYYAEEFATIVNIVAIPIFSIGSWLAFRNNKYNFAEHFILNVYVCAQQLIFVWLTIPFLEIFSGNKDVIIAIYTGLTIAYNLWVFTTFFEGKRWLNFLKSAIAITLAYIVQVPLNYGVYYFLRPFIKLLDAVF